MLCFICCDAESACALSLTHYSLQPGGLYVPFELQPPVSQADRRKLPWNAQPYAELIVKKSPCSIAFRMISSRPSATWIDQHLCLAFLCHRDYFGRSDASLSCSFVPQGLFRPAECISIWLFCSTGIISAVRIHLYLALLFHKDYFNRPDSSLSGSFAPQGLFRPSGFISIWLFWYTTSMQILFSPQLSYKFQT